MKKTVKRRKRQVKIAKRKMRINKFIAGNKWDRLIYRVKMLPPNEQAKIARKAHKRINKALARMK